MRILEGFLRLFNAMYIGVVLGMLVHLELQYIEKVLIILKVIAIVMWLWVDIKRMKMEVQE